MPDREKVIKGLGCCSKGNCDTVATACPYKETDGGYCIETLCNDALTLLKEQDPVEPILKMKAQSKFYNYYVCPVCGEDITYEQKFCSECGRRMKWNG